MMNKLYLSMLIVYLSILMIGMSSASTLGTFKQNSCIILEQTCGNCTYVNITSLTAKNDTSSVLLISQTTQMTKQNTWYNYTFCNTSFSGEYTYNTQGNPDGIVVTEPVTFLVSPSGSELTSNESTIVLGSIIVMLMVSTIFLIFGYKLENIVAKMSFYSFAVIGFTMVILYTVVTIQQILYGFDNIISGIETFWFVFRIGLTIGAVAFFIVIALIMLKAWKIKRGMIDP